MTTMAPHTIATVDQKSESAHVLRRVFNNLYSSNTDVSPRVFPPLPPPSNERLEASMTEPALDFGALSSSDITTAEEKGRTVLYLAYGSNLCNETFQDKRGIRPLSQVNVLVPSLRLTFDLAGIPYHEPCFANSALTQDADESEYHKTRWHKGMVGCVYEVTPTDYAHIIATEGGGASYHDILVACHPLSADCDTVPESPSSRPFKAHTLFAPVSQSSRLARPDPNYAQPSARYLKLITDGAAELGLPREYQVYLDGIRSYTVTSKRQALGQKMVVGLWWPVLMAFFALTKSLQDDKGRAPKWVGTLMGWIFLSMWLSYDEVWKRLFGDGERTEGDEEDHGIEVRRRSGVERRLCELCGVSQRGDSDEKQSLV